MTTTTFTESRPGEFRAAAAEHLNRAAAARRNAVVQACGGKAELALAKRLLACARRWSLRAQETNSQVPR